MSTYPPEELLKRWKREELTAEQVIGYLIQLLMALEKRVKALEARPQVGQ